MFVEAERKSRTGKYGTAEIVNAERKGCCFHQEATKGQITVREVNIIEMKFEIDLFFKWNLRMNIRAIAIPIILFILFQ
jgi:hypothetical protein